MLRGRWVGLAVALFALAATPASAKTHWLCKPGTNTANCTPSLSTTSLSPTGQVLGVKNVRRDRQPRFDCFYVYPTVSDQPTPQATFAIDPEINSIVFYQAARYTQHCRLFVPVYRQLTLQGIGVSGASTATPQMRQTAYKDVLDAWRDYLKRYNDGRGVVLIGHSQGTYVRAATSSTSPPAGRSASSAASSPTRPSTSRSRPRRSSAARPSPATRSCAPTRRHSAVVRRP